MRSKINILIIFSLASFTCNNKNERVSAGRVRIEKAINYIKGRNRIDIYEFYGFEKFSTDFDTVLNKNTIVELPIIEDIYKKDSITYCRISTINSFITFPVNKSQLKSIKGGVTFVMLVKVMTVKKMGVEVDSQPESDEVPMSIPLDTFIIVGELIDVVDVDKYLNP